MEAWRIVATPPLPPLSYPPLPASLPRHLTLQLRPCLVWAPLASPPAAPPPPLPSPQPPPKGRAAAAQPSPAPSPPLAVLLLWPPRRLLLPLFCPWLWGCLAVHDHRQEPRLAPPVVTALPKLALPPRAVAAAAAVFLAAAATMFALALSLDSARRAVLQQRQRLHRRPGRCCCRQRCLDLAEVQKRRAPQQPWRVVPHRHWRHS
mmetsp:Transcript_146613/g.266530  ORF Transcript_146613/g.266530 Transcript_146613/m.266530 type:complete len:205 (+) Transcript_146613:307-921(+)